MLSHDLAKILLENENFDVATHANNHTYSSKEELCYGRLKIAVLKHYAGNHIIIGNMDKKELNSTNYYITKMIHGEINT